MGDDLTPDEREQMEDTGIDAEEEHRYAEFEALRDLIEGLSGKVDRLIDMYSGAASADVLDGEVVTDGAVAATDVDGDGDVDIVDMTPDIDGEDLQI